MSSWLLDASHWVTVPYSNRPLIEEHFSDGLQLLTSMNVLVNICSDSCLCLFSYLLTLLPLGAHVIAPGAHVISSGGPREKEKINLVNVNVCTDGVAQL